MSGIQDMKSLLDIAKEVSSKISGEKLDSLQIECMNYLGKYVTTITADNAFAKFIRKSGTLDFSYDTVYNARVYSIKPIMIGIPDAVIKKSDRITIDLTKCKDSEILRVEVDYRLERSCVQGLIHHRSSPEPLADAMKYHLSAQLVDPSSLIKGFSEVDVEEYPVTASVNIQEYLDTTYPILGTIRKLKDIENKMLSISDPRKGVEIIGLQKERSRLIKKIQREAPNTIMKEIVSILGPMKFLKYLKVDERDFRLHNCEWSGVDSLMSVSNFTIPRHIEVTTRTDLTLKKPASKGQLTYNSGKFEEDITDIIKQ
ncbi:MAG: hypothetical protein AB9819_04310 [Methanomassiliicoccales archaeon]